MLGPATWLFAFVAFFLCQIGISFAYGAKCKVPRNPGFKYCATIHRNQSTIFYCIMQYLYLKMYFKMISLQLINHYCENFMPEIMELSYYSVPYYNKGFEAICLLSISYSRPHVRRLALV